MLWAITLNSARAEVPAVQWWLGRPNVEQVIIEGQPVDGGPWAPIVTLDTAKFCTPRIIIVGGNPKDRAFCHWAPKQGVPRATFFRLRTPAPTSPILELPRLSLTCLKPGSVPVTASVGGAAAIWPMDAAATKGCP